MHELLVRETHGYDLIGHFGVAKTLDVLLKAAIKTNNLTSSFLVYFVMFLAWNNNICTHPKLALKECYPGKGKPLLHKT
jgi:hypothetical protein